MTGHGHDDVVRIELALHGGPHDGRQDLLGRRAARCAVAATDFSGHHGGPQRLLRTPVVVQWNRRAASRLGARRLKVGLKARTDGEGRLCYASSTSERTQRCGRMNAMAKEPTRMGSRRIARDPSRTHLPAGCYCSGLLPTNAPLDVYRGKTARLRNGELAIVGGDEGRTEKHVRGGHVEQIEAASQELCRAQT